MEYELGKSESIIVLAALGIMADELTNPAPLDEISFSLRVDFQQKKVKDVEIVEILTEAEQSGLCKRIGDTWILTPEGENRVDNYIRTL